MGALFKDARIKAGIDIQDAARSLKIKREYLAAIENNEDYILPAQVYVDGYKRLYAKYLGIEITEIMPKEEEVKKPAPTTKMLFKKKYADKMLVPSSVILVFILIYCWQFITSDSPISVIDDVILAPEEYIKDNFTFPYMNEYNLKHIELY